MEGDPTGFNAASAVSYFNPLPPRGGRRLNAPTMRVPHDFNPLPPRGGRQTDVRSFVDMSEFQSTPSAWRETVQLTSKTATEEISIHSLRVEGDAPVEKSTA